MNDNKSQSPPKSSEERDAKLEKELKSNRAKVQTNDNLAEGLPSPEMGRAQADFMKPEHADHDSNEKSGAL